MLGLWCLCLYVCTLDSSSQMNFSKYDNYQVKVSARIGPKRSIGSKRDSARVGVVLAGYPIVYNDSSRIFKQARTTSPDGKVWDVTKDLIEDKALASSVSGFDEKRQLKISFGNLDIGATVGW